MVVSANHFKDVTNGYEKRTDGLWFHRGKFSVGPPGLAPSQGGDINANRGNNTGVYYFAGDQNKYIFYNGTEIVFSPPLGSAALAPGAAQGGGGSYAAGTSFSTTAGNVWLATPISTGPIACSGAVCRVEADTILYHSVAGGLTYVGLMLDGGVLANMGGYSSPGASYYFKAGFTYYYTPTVAAHTFALAVHMATAGTLTMLSSTVSTLYVTEQRR